MTLMILNSADREKLVEAMARKVCGAIQTEPGLCGGDADPADVLLDAMECEPVGSCVACRNVARAALSALNALTKDAD